MSRIKAVLFDLDGTLLPMDQDAFTGGYFKLLAAKAAPRGYEPKGLVDAIWKGTAAMVRNDGSMSNEDAFWAEFARIYGEDALADKELFDAFYDNEFKQAQAFCGFAPGAAQSVQRAKELGFRVALATNPIFPRTATLHRISWAGLQPQDFELFTSYENSSLCKPNPAYFTDVAARMGLQPQDCLMVGNDATEDLAAVKAGMQVFLITDALINKKDVDISACPQGSWPQLIAHLEALAE
ncbi:MAG: HAD family hydrolase [Coriobacteriales bacterium]